VALARHLRHPLPALPEDVLDELADALCAGRKVGLAARNEAVGALARDALLLLLDEGEGRA
jgi:hypothetical protein